MRKNVYILSAALFCLLINVPAIAANPAPGASCPKFGATASYKSIKYRCIIKYKKLVWDNGSIVSKKVSITSKPTVSSSKKPVPVKSLSANSITALNPPNQKIDTKPSVFNPILRVISANSSVCEIQIDNYDPSFMWIFDGNFELLSKKDNIFKFQSRTAIAITNSTFTVRTQKTGYSEGVAYADCSAK